MLQRTLVRSTVKIFSSILIALLLWGCANVVPPEGGKKDETPPVLLSISPKDSSLNSKPTKIQLRFNKFMEVKELEKNLSTSPLLAINPQVIIKGKRVEIKLTDSLLLDNTTYQIHLGKALVDNREANPYEFHYIFSTGSYFDSLELKGIAINAFTGKPDTAALITIYDATAGDSVLLRKKPLFAQKVQSDGRFHIKLLPSKSFTVFAIADSVSNFIYDRWIERVGFLPEPIMAHTAENDSAQIVLYTFKEAMPELPKDTVDTKDSIANAEEQSSLKSLAGKRRAFSKPKSDVPYLVNVDTTNLELRTQDITKPLSIDLATVLKTLDSAKIFLSYENNDLELEAISNITVDSNEIQVNTQWQGDKKYTLRLVKGWATDTANNELMPGKYSFRTKSDKDYSTLKINVDSTLQSDSLLLIIRNSEDTVIYDQPITNAQITLAYLQPGTYTLNLVVDNNRNGKWDTGDLFEKKQPEKTLPYQGSILLKAGWENETDLKPESLITDPLHSNSGGLRKKRFSSGKDTPTTEDEN